MSLRARIIVGVVLMAAALFFILFPAYMKGNSVTVMVTITVAGLLYIGVLVAVRLRKRSTPGTS